MKLPSPPQKKSDFSEKLQQDQSVMQAMQNGGKPKQSPEVEKAKNDLRRIIKQVGIDPQKIIQAGKYAEMALKDPKLYPMVIENAVKSGLLTQEQVPKEPGINWQLLSQGITAGKLTQQLLEEGKL
jgi:hypothetical protein